MIDIANLIDQTYTVIPHSSKTMTTIEHDSLIIWPESNSYTWFSKFYGRFTAGGGPSAWLTYELGMSDDEAAEYINENSTFTIRVAEQEFETTFPKGHKRYNEYIRGRNISEETAELFQLETWKGDTIIPMYDTDGIRAGSLIRSSSSDATAMKYKKVQSREICNLWSPEQLERRFDAPVFVFEGAWSAMRWYQVSKGYIAPLAMLGTNAGSDTIELLNGVQDVHFILDNDKESEAGEGVMKRIIRNELYDRSLRWKFLLPDEYPDEMSDETVRKYLRYCINGIR